MHDVVGKKYIFAVAQRPFEIESGTGIQNQFCALLPLFDPDGVPANPQDFPDNGDVWWMLRPGTRGLAEPGRLVTAVLEESVKFGSPGLAQYQANVDSVTAIHGRDYVEIIDIPAHAISEVRDLISTTFRHTLDHCPIDTVSIRWKHFLLGRFSANATESSSEPGKWEVRFSPESSERTAFRVSREVVDRIVPSNRLEASCEVSLETRPIYDSTQVNYVQYLLVESEALMREIPADCDQASMKTDREVVQQLAKSLFSRTKRQQLMQLLDELGDQAAQSDQPSDNVDQSVLAAMRKAITVDVKASSELAQAIIKAGFMKSQMDAAIVACEGKHISENAARIQSEINQKVSVVRSEFDTLQKQKSSIQADLEHLRARKKKELDKELGKRRSEFERELRRQEEDAQKRLTSIQKQEKVLTENLKKVATTLVENRDDVVNQLLMIAPILSQFGLFGGQIVTQTTHSGLPQPVSAEPQHNTKSEGQNASSFQLPAFSFTDCPAPVSELDFFTRFKAYVSARGYRYRDIDLLAFHISVKCGDLTILGGQPGTGKSSLPRLYAEALRGERNDQEHERFLHVAVSPSWLDSRDLLGHLNALNHSFQPADSSLYETLIVAQEEQQELGDASGMYLVCLDEMNLSHVEHYFGDFLQVFEMPTPQRVLRVFSKSAVSASCEFRRWSQVLIPRSVRFIGTVNFDETTKQLSQRLLDRTNLIRLPADQLPLELEEAMDAKATGAEVRMQQYQSWVRDSAAYSDALGKLIDDLREDLRILNCSMNPRRFSAIRKFLASWPVELAPIEKAIDIQIAQRILPQIRGLFQPGASDAIKSIRRKLEQHEFSFDESLRILEDIYRNESPEFAFDAEALN
jgi:hypothetical protein